MLYLSDSHNKVKAKLFIENFSIRQHYSFMDLYIKNSINIVPIIGVDFSMANLTFDDAQNFLILHSLKNGAPNDYIDCLKSVQKSFYHFYRFMLAYGFGARTWPNVGKPSQPASTLFSLTGSFMDPFISTETRLVNCYEKTLKAIELALPVIYQKIIQHVCDIA